MERSIMSAIARLGTIEILKSDSEVKKRFNSLIDNISEGAIEMEELVDAIMTEGADVVNEVLEAKEDLEYILDYFLKTGMDLWEELYNEKQTLGESRFIDSMASKIIQKAKEQKLL